MGLSGRVHLGGHGLADELYGGLGDDTYVVDTIGDTLVELAGEGFDTVETTAPEYTLPANIEALIFTGVGAFIGTGNASANVITGGAGADTIRYPRRKSPKAMAGALAAMLGIVSISLTA